jgi:DNA-binding NtrC family response regulator
MVDSARRTIAFDVTSAPPRILVVDDDDAIRELVAEYLRGRGADAEAWSDGASALASLTARRPDAIVTDLKLPDMSGVDIVSAASRCSPPVPVVVTTGYGTVESAVASLTSGASDFILKPFRLRDLYSAVERARDRARREWQADSDRETLGLFLQAEAAATPDDAEQLVRALLDRLARTEGVTTELAAGLPDDPDLTEEPGWRPLGLRHRLRVQPLPESVVPWILAVHRALLRCES